MKGIRFYADMVGTRYDPGEHGFPSGRLPRNLTRARLRELADAQILLNCIALLTGDEHRNYDGTQEALVATFIHANSDTSLGSVSLDYLRKCRRIDEATARTLHPRLASLLDAA